MIFNVAQLMKSPVGTSLVSDIDEENVQLDEDIKIVGSASGQVRLRHINQGLLVDGQIDLTVELTCTRCLKTFKQELHLELDERYRPTVDVVTGVPLPAINEDDVFPIDDHHQVDLTESVRQQLLLAIPIATVCKEDCAGLCAQCGKDLNLGPCECEPEVDTRLSVLKTLLEDKLES